MTLVQAIQRHQPRLTSRICRDSLLFAWTSRKRSGTTGEMLRARELEKQTRSYGKLCILCEALCCG